ncbi:hypothetical protein FSP39_000146 [Pinctada imbricata]|uniref:C1q domain-containing protein n=1 Tax=Pinctada imbricata TaxID=66713 RepID=A0AA88XKA6_PINIB|nr:hypothetical protein FSP39_000146 [Pinctada imbricata]
MPFEHVITIHGNGYNPGTSVFTAPAYGYFVFFWEIQVPPDTICDTDIKKNGDYILGLGADARGNTGSQSTSRLIILDLERGDRVWIQTGRCDAIYDGIYSTFSGLRIA